jgi:TetR/AcrR family transcriptional regulator, transcriptional repressor of bet genes
MAIAGKPVDKRKLRGQESRSHILQSAIISIAKLGLGNLTLDRVAEQAGISRGLVVFHFKSKSRLLEEVLNFLGKQYADGWYAVLNQHSDSTLDKLLQLTDFDVQFCYRNPKYVAAWHAFWGEARGNVLYHNLSLPRDERYASELKQLLAAMIEESGQDAGDLSLLSAGLTAMLFGVWVESHLYPDPRNCEIYRKSLRLYLARSFPGHQVPLTPSSS